MNAFVRVVEAGSFTKAANTLDVPKPTVSRLVQSLEQKLRVRLLDRTTRSVTVTAEGATYYERVVRLLAELGDIESSAMLSVARPSGRLRVDVATAIATKVLIPALPQFYAAYPEMELEFSVSNRHSDLVAENVDCVVRAGPLVEELLAARRVGEFRLLTCAAPAYLHARGMPKDLEELATRHQLLGMVSPRSGKPIPMRFIAEGKTLEIAPHARLAIDDTNAHLAAGVAGLGILQAPAYMLQGEIASGLLQPVLEKWQTPLVPVHVLYRPNRFLSAKVRVFIDWTVALFERNPHLKLD